MSERRCGPCGACCTIPAVPSLSKPADTDCPNQSCGGCAIYSTRPQECRDYRCLWLDDEIGEGEPDRPDQLGLVFDLPTLIEEHPDYAGILVICARELWPRARDGERARMLLVRVARTFIVRLTAPGGRTQLMGPRASIEAVVRAAERRAAGN